MTIVVDLPQKLESSAASPLYSRHLKRVVDLGLAILLVPVFLPVIVLLAILVRRDGGPIFFGHERIGRRGKSFHCWKLRTMAPNAKEIIEKHFAENPEAAQEWNIHQKLVNDPRVTRLGRLLRATSLDELPQLWNVIRGEMSLVGPRPVTQAELERYRGFESFYLAVRPGLTGLWQVSGRNEINYLERVKLDVNYVKSCSMKGDVMILIRTFGAVLRRSGC